MEHLLADFYGLSITREYESSIIGNESIGGACLISDIFEISVLLTFVIAIFLSQTNLVTSQKLAWSL